MLVLCCGHPDRGDDAAGPLVAQRLREMGIDARQHSGDALSLMDAWQGAADVALVDAVVTGKRPGTVSLWNALSAPVSGRTRPGSSHALGLAEAIALGRTLGALPRRLTLYGIEARHFELGAPPSKAVLRGVERAARKVYEHCLDQRRAPV
ncbi:MAG TPA: hydrogenase maturation protease [Bryobacteraceae bacterium]|nr:hydrogenase maturation protease [Bryobacteraceae bacterium]